MCGIFGIYSQSKPCQLDEILVSLSHRGPDENALYQSELSKGFVGCGSTRLAIVNSSMKLQLEKGSLIILFNGEIWNYRALGEELSLENGSEVDVIAELYLQHGSKFAEKLDGMFAIAIIDRKLSKITLARDPVGIKPLFYLQNSSELLFASDIKTLVQMSNGQIEGFNYNYFINQFVFGFSDYKDTLVNGVQALPASSTMVYDCENQVEHIETYLSQVSIKAPLIDDEEKFEEVMKKAILKWYHHCDFYPIALLLSGGIDSSLLAILSWKLGLKNIRCFFVGDPSNGDYQWAQKVAEVTGYPLETIALDPKEIVELIPEICHFKPGLFRGIHIYMAFKKIKERYPEIKVAWCGEGADEVFGGYPDHANAQATLEKIDEKKGGVGDQTPLMDRFFGWKEDPTAFLHTFYQREQLIENHLLPFDHCSMAHSIELRVPFLDLELFQKVPQEVVLSQIKTKEQKKWLKNLLKKYSGIEDEEFYHRKKMGFPNLVASYAPHVAKLAMEKYPISLENVKKPLDRIFLEISRNTLFGVNK